MKLYYINNPDNRCYNADNKIFYLLKIALFSAKFIRIINLRLLVLLIYYTVLT
jgi:hypothetical protein